MEGKQFHLRVFAVLGLFFSIVLALTWVLYDVQIVQGPAFAAQSKRKIAQIETVDASRGELLDRYGRVMVDNLPSYNVSLSTTYMGDGRNDVLLRLLAICRAQGVLWADTLPLSTAAPFTFTLAEATPTGANSYRKYMDTLKDADQFRMSTKFTDSMDFAAYRADGDKLIAFLRQQYKIDEAVSDEDARALVGVLYELALRTKEISVVAYVFAQNVDINFITAVKEAGLTGVNFDPTSVRQYHTEYAAHILGRVGLMDGTEWETYGPLGYPYNASVGKDGVEQAFEEYLHGTSGKRQVERNTNGKIVSESWAVDTKTGQTLAPEPGYNVMLSLDRQLQGAVERALAEGIANLPSKEAQGGAAVVMDMTGGVLAMASYPTFDLSNYALSLSQSEDDPLNPLYSRATMGQYAPGSTFKMVTAVGGLQEGIITPTTLIKDTGKYTYYKDYQPACWIYRQYGGSHGTINVSTAVEKSCNIFFYDVGRRLGISEIQRYATMFGLGDYTGIELNESKGIIAGPQYTESLGQTWNEGATLAVAIGQENNQFTPLQLANYTATLANGGTHYRASLLKTVKSNDYSQVIYEREPEVRSTIDIDDKNLAAVKAGMLRVAQGSRYFKDLPFDVGAKTGSAQVSTNTESNAVYVAFAPYDDPQIAIAIVVERGGSGSELGAIAEDIMDFYFSADSNLELLERENTLIR